MDSLDDNEIESIWSRVKKYVEVDGLRSKSIPDLEQELKSKMRDADETTGLGSMQSLIKAGFPERLAELKGKKEPPKPEPIKIKKKAVSKRTQAARKGWETRRLNQKKKAERSAKISAGLKKYWSKVKALAKTKKIPIKQARGQFSKNKKAARKQTAKS